jgi:hypothetical protein
MNIISEDIYFRQTIDILLADTAIGFSDIGCVEGGQVIAFFRPSVIGKE